jgi:Na+-transporting methylmalonyl-CoA/oxaloacetate decarboxylase gamma subunit
LSAPKFRGKVAAQHIDRGEAAMDNLSFGLTMTVVGVGGTFLTLWVLSLLVDLLKKVFPLRAQDEPGKNA